MAGWTMGIQSKLKLQQSDSVQTGSRVTHYHIRWQNSKLDWEAFQTQEAAETQASAISLSNETFVRRAIGR